MVLIATQDADLALQLVGHIDEQKVVVLRTRDATELRQKIYGAQPEVVVLDVRFGGSAYRVIEHVERIIDKTASRPAVILLLPWDSKDVERTAAELRCYDAITLSDGACERVGLAVTQAREARLSGALARAPKDDPILH